MELKLGRRMIDLKLICRVKKLFLLEKILNFKWVSHVTLRVREEIILGWLGVDHLGIRIPSAERHDEGSFQCINRLSMPYNSK